MGGGKVGADDERRLVRVGGYKIFSGCNRSAGIKVGTARPVGLLDLARVVDAIASNKRLLCL